MSRTDLHTVAAHHPHLTIEETGGDNLAAVHYSDTGHVIVISEDAVVTYRTADAWNGETDNDDDLLGERITEYTTAQDALNAFRDHLDALPRPTATVLDLTPGADVIVPDVDARSYLLPLSATNPGTRRTVASVEPWMLPNGTQRRAGRGKNAPLSYVVTFADGTETACTDALVWFLA